jgi:hypothetical protein
MAKTQQPPLKELLQLLAEVLEVPPPPCDDDTVAPFDVLEHAMATLGITVELPCNATPVAVGEWHRKLRRGDHIVVRSAGSNEVFHQAIYIGPHTPPGQEESDYVVDMLDEPHEEGKQGPGLRLRSMTRFMKTRGHPELAVIEYSGDTPVARDCTAHLALTVQAQLSNVEGLYHVLGCDCENFAAWCRHPTRWEDHNDLVYAAINSLPAFSPRSHKF